MKSKIKAENKPRLWRVSQERYVCTKLYARAIDAHTAIEHVRMHAQHRMREYDVTGGTWSAEPAKHFLLEPGNLVRDGDEEYIGGRWHPVACEHIGYYAEAACMPVRRLL